MDRMIENVYYSIMYEQSSRIIWYKPTLVCLSQSSVWTVVYKCLYFLLLASVALVTQYFAMEVIQTSLKSLDDRWEINLQKKTSFWELGKSVTPKNASTELFAKSKVCYTYSCSRNSPFFSYVKWSHIPTPACRKMMLIYLSCVKVSSCLQRVLAEVMLGFQWASVQCMVGFIYSASMPSYPSVIGLCREEPVKPPVLCSRGKQRENVPCPSKDHSIQGLDSLSWFISSLIKYLVVSTFFYNYTPGPLYSTTICSK